MVAGLLAATPMPVNAGVGQGEEGNCLRSEYRAIKDGDSLYRVKRIFDGPGVRIGPRYVHERFWGADGVPSCSVMFNRYSRTVVDKSR
jgi:hypothetical protein